MLRGEGIRLAWPATGKLYRAMKDGSTFVSDDGGRTWQDRGKIDGEPYKLHPVGPDELYIALADGTILHSKDGLRSTQPVFTPDYRTFAANAFEDSRFATAFTVNLPLASLRLPDFSAQR